MRLVDVRGTAITAATQEDVIAAVDAMIQSGEGGTVCLANVHVVEAARRDDPLREALEAADLVLPDGAPIAWAIRRGGCKDVRRISGSALFRGLCARGETTGVRHFFLGGTPGTLTTVVEATERSFPRLAICGSNSPPYQSADRQDAESLGRLISAAAANVVWVGMGAPKQEVLMTRLRPFAPQAVFIGVGAVFDFVAGTKRRAPQWMRRAGLEWLFRLVTEPRRLLRRYAVTNTTFVTAVLTSALGRGAESTQTRSD